MRVLLIQPPNNMSLLFKDAKIFTEPMEPMGLLYIAEYLLSKDVDVQVKDYYSDLIPTEEMQREIAESDADFIGISCLASNANVVYALGQWIKKNCPDKKVALGNLHASYFADFFLNAEACDYVIHGEGEIAFHELLMSYNDQEQLSKVKGLSYIEENKIKFTGQRPPLKELDTLPYPRRNLLDRTFYRFTHINRGKADGKNFAAVFTSRGCVNQCTFCCVNNKRTYRTRSPENVVEEIEYLVNKLNVEIIGILDSLFTADSQRVLGICSLLKKKNINIPWTCEIHAKYISEDLLKAMKNAGCYEVALGIESGNQESLDIIRKNTTIEQIKEVVYMGKKIGLRVSGLFILGLPGETREMTMNTIEFARSLPLDFAQFSILTPFPGTPLYEKLIKAGDIETGNTVDEILSNWLRYIPYPSFTGMKPIWTTPGRTYEELNYCQRLALRKFYMRPRFIWEKIKMLNFKNILPVIRLFLGLFKK